MFNENLDGLDETSFNLIYEELKKFQILSAELTIDQWIATVRTIIARNQRNKRFKQISQYGLIISLVISFLSVAGKNPSLFANIIATISVPACLFFIFGRVYYFCPICSNRELENSILPLLLILNLDVNPYKPVKLHLDLRDQDHEQKLIRCRDVSDRYRSKVLMKNYLSSLLEIKALLCNGNTLTLKINDLCRRRDKYKTNINGTKTKIKYKFSIKRHIHISLSFKNTKYQYIGDRSNIYEKQNERRNIIQYSVIENDIRYNQLLDTKGIILNISSVCDALSHRVKK